MAESKKLATVPEILEQVRRYLKAGKWDGDADSLEQFYLDLPYDPERKNMAELSQGIEKLIAEFKRKT